MARPGGHDITDPTIPDDIETLPLTVDKYQMLQNYMGKFGIPAYEETSVPDNAQLPYLTYEAGAGYFDDTILGTFSLWYRDTSWASIIAKSEEIAADIGRGGKLLPYTGGAIWLRRGNPWAQRMSEPSDDMIRRIVHNYIIEFVE